MPDALVAAAMNHFSFESAQALEVPTIVGGKYRLLRQLGVGGMGAVWVARNEATGAEVALKVLLGPDGAAELVTRMRREAHATARLSHRGIVRIFDLIDIGAQVGIVMELLHGKTLADHLRERGKIPVDEAVSIALAILSALDHAHARDVVHRDLKPENVFLAVDPDGIVTPKILDFGISKVRAPHTPIITQQGEMLGTPSYMSPEQVCGQAWVDGRSDLFNVGILLYEMLSGRNPFVVGSFHSILMAILEEVPKPIAGAPPALWKVIERALSKTPDERFSTARELSVALRGAVGLPDAAASHPPEGLALAGFTVPTPRPRIAVLTPPPRSTLLPPRGRARWGFLATAVASAVLAAGTATVLAVWSSAAAPEPSVPAAAATFTSSSVETPVVERAVPAWLTLTSAGAADVVVVEEPHPAPSSAPAASSPSPKPPPPPPRAVPVQAAPRHAAADKRPMPSSIPLPAKPPPKLIARTPGF